MLLVEPLLEQALLAESALLCGEFLGGATEAVCRGADVSSQGRYAQPRLEHC
jgi:hypothetical protein